MVTGSNCVPNEVAKAILEQRFEQPSAQGQPKGSHQMLVESTSDA